ncbi:hypothetical protein CKO42_01360 [Lamprobacter modestohalophilus]|uniref:DUF302 domain-containing protein n=1 Tax=Lamprobacter modestohalophilus TaxID=1064514 RepID=A0A9X0W6E7_9GAMM|nr:DUF302 domain-containing protein [Lamprobacter modestohalophilus]MBK1617118.1 hypothetical protein [Lamprobacter modestohalophilus]MCF8003647.1 DUF302 domain-containing protein [Chromatiaceae bacterium]
MYSVSAKVSTSFDDSIARVTEALKTEGFGVLSDIDVAKTLNAKLGVEQPPYRILGACNPQLAHQAVSAEPDIGALLPCNVVVRQDPDGTVHVLFMDPMTVLTLVDNPKVQELASEVRERLDRVLAAISG